MMGMRVVLLLLAALPRLWRASTRRTRRSSARAAIETRWGEGALPSLCRVCTADVVFCDTKVRACSRLDRATPRCQRRPQLRLLPSITRRLARSQRRLRPRWCATLSQRRCARAAALERTTSNAHTHSLPPREPKHLAMILTAARRLAPRAWPALAPTSARGGQLCIAAVRCVGVCVAVCDRLRVDR